MKEQVKQPVKRVLINTVPNTFAFVSPMRLPFTTAQLPQDEFLISGSLEQVSPCTAPSQGQMSHVIAVGSPCCMNCLIFEDSRKRRRAWGPLRIIH